MTSFFQPFLPPSLSPPAVLTDISSAPGSSHHHFIPPSLRTHLTQAAVAPIWSRILWTVITVDSATCGLGSVPEKTAVLRHVVTSGNRKSGTVLASTHFAIAFSKAISETIISPNYYGLPR